MPILSSLYDVLLSSYSVRRYTVLFTDNGGRTFNFVILNKNIHVLNERTSKHCNVICYMLYWYMLIICYMLYVICLCYTERNFYDVNFQLLMNYLMLC